MSRKDRLPPSKYTGELLCSYCGRGQETGNRYARCVEGFPHEDSCAKYDYGDLFLCPECTEMFHNEAAKVLMGLDLKNRREKLKENK